MKNKYLKMIVAAMTITLFAGSVQYSSAEEITDSAAKAVTTTQPQATATEQTTSVNPTEGETNTDINKTKITIQPPKIKKGYVKDRASLMWKKSKKKDGYEIWASEKKKGKYKKIATTTGVSYRLRNLSSGKLYYIKVRAYRKVNGKIYKSSFTKRITQVLTNVKFKKVKSQFAGRVTLNWEKGKNINGYCIQYSTDRNFKQKKTIKIQSKSEESVNIYDLSQNKKYYVRMRTYKKIGKKIVYSLWSQVRTVKVSGTGDIINGSFKSTDGYFKNSVFFGDSVLQGYQIYINSKGKGYLDNVRVMGVVSYSLIAALQDESKYHPLYQGKHVAPEYITKSLGAEKVFLFFGINDIYNTQNPEYTFENYKELISRIKKVNPGVKIHVISSTYPMKGSKDYVNYSKRLHQLNEKMRNYCDETDCEYIDIASYISTSDGYLKSELCSDNFVHQTMQSYEIWDKVLRAYAWSYNHAGK